MSFYKWGILRLTAYILDISAYRPFLGIISNLEVRCSVIQKSLFFLCLVILFGSCEDPTSNGSDGKITTQADADRVATIISGTWDQPAPWYNTGTFNYIGETVYGNADGYAVVDGTYTKVNYSGGYDSIRTYTSMDIEFYSYAENNDYSSMTGDAWIGGTIYYDSPNYTGNWLVMGVVTLSPPANSSFDVWSYNCSVNYTFTYYSPYHYQGTIYSGGNSWSVSN